MATLPESERDSPSPQQQHQQQQLPDGGCPQQPQPGHHAQRHKQMRALFSFEKQVEGDLSFKKDDILQLVDNSNEFWWKMCNPETGETGYVPFNYIQSFDGGPTSMTSWFDVDRRDAEWNLLMPGLQEGTFLLRPCHQQTVKAVCCLSVRTEEQTHGECKLVGMRHYKVLLTEDSAFYISPRKTFTSMQNLIRHYQSSPDGLCCRLTNPCPRAYVPPPHFSDFELNRNQLSLQEKLGHGSFGEVWRAKLSPLVEVAVKKTITNEQGTTMKREDFIREAETMCKLHHPNILQLLGVCTTEEPFYIVTELMPNGSLKEHLTKDNQNGRQITFDHMLNMMFQVSDGMAYLTEKKVVHRDLRAANILVGYGNVLKVGGFRLSRLVEDSIHVSESTKFPVRWTAPEAVTTKTLTIKSDVWSFSVLVFEIVTRGGTPYSEYKNRDIMRMVSRGYRMPNPHNESLGVHCDEFLYENVMLACWHADPAERPTFAHLCSIFQNYYAEMKLHQYLD